jgi:hypothetical protein
MWSPTEHSDDENMLWCHLRAMEWALWPIFISQPIAPVALLFLRWWVVALLTLASAALWILFVRDKLVSPKLAWWGALIVRLKWLTCPVMACVLIYKGKIGLAVLALLWPMLVLFLPLLLLPLGPPRVGEIEKKLMRSLGYEPAIRN